MNWKKIGKAILFPHIAIMIILVPIATTLLVYSMVFVGTESVIAYISYVLAAYTLTVWCARIPELIKLFKRLKNENKYLVLWQENDRLRVKVSLYGSLTWNFAYAVFQMWLGIYHSTFWFISLAGYYIFLAVMRFFLLRYTSRNVPGKNMLAELVRYRACGWIFLLMNLALSLIVLFIVYWNRTFVHHQITTIAMAAYTFTSFTTAVINVVKYRKYNSPVYSASMVISFASACVSMLTLTATMLTVFGDGTMSLLERRIMLGSVGGGISALIVVMAIYMIARSSKKIKEFKALNSGRDDYGKQ